MNQHLTPEQIQRYHEVIEEVGPEFLREKLAQMQLIRAFEQQVNYRVVDGADAVASLEDLAAALEELGLLAW